MDRLLQDLRFALRSLARHPAAALIPVITLALGIGSSTAVFSVFDAALLEPPPYHEPDRLVLLWHRTLATGGERVRVPGPDVVLYDRDTDVFEGLAFVAGADDLAMEGDGPMHVRVGVATANLFRVLGVEAAVGRTFRRGEGLATGGEEGRGGPTPVLLDHELWSGRFGADREAIGRIVRIGGVPMRVIGVLPPDFDLLLPPGT
ncbi:MAG: ABC transporter permease, partial [Gemmatimonadota bacterium]|nr:ABC transporter permease [Gemmatimonadota bacterium]